MTELDEIADTMNRGWQAHIAALGWKPRFDDAVRFVRQQMPDETPQVIDGVAYSLFTIRRSN